jgi:hypothetical protein
MRKMCADALKIAERTVRASCALDTCAELFKIAQCTNYFKSCGYEYDTG